MQRALEGLAVAMVESEWLGFLRRKSGNLRITRYPVPHTVEARKLEHHYPHALKVNYKGS